MRKKEKNKKGNDRVNVAVPRVWRSIRHGNFISYIVRRWLSGVISDWQRSRTFDQVYSRPEIQRTLLRTRRDSLTVLHNAMLCVITSLTVIPREQYWWTRLWLSIQLTIELNPGLVNKLRPITRETCSPNSLMRIRYATFE